MGDDPANYMLKAYKILMLNRHCQKNFMENVHLAYKTIVSKKGFVAHYLSIGGSMRGVDLFALIETLYVNYPGDVKNLFVQALILC